MTDIDVRFARDIAAVTGGVVVTESDLREARSAIQQAMESSRKRDRRRHAAVAAAAAVALAAVGAAAFLALGGGDDEATRLAGPGAEPPNRDPDFLTGSVPTAQLIDGVWRLDNSDTLVKFDENGTVRFDSHGRLFSQPVTTGSYAIDGDLITVTTTQDNALHCIGTEFMLRASLPEPHALRFVGGDTSRGCAPLPEGRGVLEQLAPTSGSKAGLALSGDPGWKPLTERTPLIDVWLAAGGGYVLGMGGDGGYTITNELGEPLDSGEWSWRDRRITLASAARSATCSEGARLTLGSVEWISSGGTTAFRGAVAENACGGAWTSTLWISLPGARG